MRRILLFTAALLAGFFLDPPQPLTAPTGIYTRNADNLRDGVFQEAGITVDSLKRTGVTLRTVIPVEGDAVGMEAAPLISPPVRTAKGVMNVLIAPSMANVVRGVDALPYLPGLIAGQDIWDTFLCPPAQSNGSVDMYGVNDHIGVLSTGVIDPAPPVKAYMVAACSADGSPQKITHTLFTLDAASGVILGRASFADLRSNGENYTDRPRKQRSSLVLVTAANGHKIVFGAYGSQAENGSSPAGGIFGYDATLGKWSVFLPTTDGAQAGIWMGGGGLAELGGRLIGQTGNGDFNGRTQWGESILGLDYTPASKAAAAQLRVATNFTPFSDRGRIGLDPTWAGPGARITAPKQAGVNAATEALEPSPVGGAMRMPEKTRTVMSPDRNTGGFVPLVYPSQPTRGGWTDQDLGSGGCAVVPGAQFLDGRAVAICGGKDGILYQVYVDRMGDTRTADFADTHANCAKLAAAPVWGTVWPGAVDPCAQDQTVLDFAPWGKTAHLHMTPVVYVSPVDGVTLWVWGENATLHRWRVGRDHRWVYTGESRERASAQSPYGTGGMPGAMCAASTNGGKVGTGIIWCSVPYGDANRTRTTGHLVAYAADTLTEDPNGAHLVKLWDSADHMDPLSYNKFMPVTIWQSHVYLPNYQGGIYDFTP